MVMTNISAMPLSFTENRGQWDPQALYKAEAGGAAFWFCKDEVVYQFTRDTKELLENPAMKGREFAPDRRRPDKFNHPRYKKESLAVHARFIGANPDAEIHPKDRLGYDCNYFIGNIPAKWRSDVPNYAGLVYKNLYPGIDLRFYGDGAGMKYDFTVVSGSDISQIRIKYDGVEKLSIAANGELEASTLFGPVYENIPEIYQEINGNRENRGGRYILRGDGVYGFEVEDYDPNYPLVIDPLLVYSTYLGGNYLDCGWGISVDSSGAAYITGETYSSDFPTENPYQIHQSGNDVFVTKLSPSGNRLVYSTYLGGSGPDAGMSIAVDNSGAAYVTGEAYSPNFPTHNPFQTYQGGEDAFLTKLSPFGNALVYSTYLGGEDIDLGFDISVNGSGQAYVTGLTYSSDFPVQNPFQMYQGDADGFVTRFSASGNSLIYSTYLGGNDTDWGWGIAIDSRGAAFITGDTQSRDFPTRSPYQLYGENGDAFVTKLSASGNAPIYSTFLGGSSTEWGYDIAVDSSGAAYATGVTLSPDFPTQDPLQQYQGYEDIYVTKLSVSGNSLIYSTFLGGSGSDWGWGISVDKSGAAYVTGSTQSQDFPTQDPYQSYQGGYDAFITKFSAFGNSLVYSTYLGGSSDEGGQCVWLDDFGAAYITGETYSSNFPIQNPFQTDRNNEDAFVTKLGAYTGINEDVPPPSVFSLSQNYPNPFNSSTAIGFDLPSSSHVNLALFDILGRKVETLIDGKQSAGHHEVIWDATELPSGIYFYKIQAGEFIETKKMLMVK